MPVGRLLLAAVLCTIMLGGVTGCARDEDLAEIIFTAEHDGFRSRVWIPINEPRSTGTYRAEIVWPNGAEARIENERDGMITGVWLVRLEHAETPKLIVATSSSGSGTYGSVDVYDLGDGDIEQLVLSPLDESVSSGYMGHDVISVEGGRLQRTYPVYLEDDTNAEPSGGTTRLWYSFADSAWMGETGGEQD